MAIILSMIPASTAGSGLADLPYRLVPAMTSSIGTELSSLSASGSLIVWEDRRSGQPDIFAYDVSDTREFRVSRLPDVRRQPAISGPVIVWISGLEPGERTVRGIDLAEGVEFEITDEPADIRNPTISGDTIAWQQRVDGNWQVQMVQRESDRMITLSDEASPAGRPSVDGDVVVWQEFDGQSWNIRSFDASTNLTTDVTSSEADDQYPRVSGDAIAFIRNGQNGGSPEIVVINVDGTDERSLVSGHFVSQPSIHGNIVVWEDWRSGLPDIYAYDLAHDQMFAVARSQQAASPVVSERIIAWASGRDAASQRIQALEIQMRLPTDPQEPPAVPDPDRLYIPQTQQYVSSGFKSFWQSLGGVQLLGYPLTGEFTEVDSESGNQIIVQYFERGKLEYHPDAPEGERIRMARIGFEMLPSREADPVEPFESDDNRAYFPETGQAVSHGFKSFWEDNGGVGVFGFPLTGEFVEHGRTVQYFERARFEFNPDASAASRVQLGLIGREALQERGWIPLPPIDTTSIFE